MVLPLRSDGLAALASLLAPHIPGSRAAGMDRGAWPRRGTAKLEGSKSKPRLLDPWTRGPTVPLAAAPEPLAQLWLSPLDTEGVGGQNYCFLLHPSSSC